MSDLVDVSTDIRAVMDSFSEAVRVASGVVLKFGESMAAHNRRLSWELRITFADTDKERRRVRRDMARAYRRPALIHQGGKP